MGLKNSFQKGALLADLDVKAMRPLTQMSDEEYGARVLGHYYGIALHNLDCFSLVVDHSELCASSIEAIARLFGLEGRDDRRLRLELSRQSKRDDGAVYVDDTFFKRSAASEAAKAATADWANAQYEALLEARGDRVR